ncbi:hypothetical protein GCM10007231_34420 [Nocardioides daphniae]|nr:hypothetical protein GCM10007231_34420 [Nocardioides daphniae]
MITVTAPHPLGSAVRVVPPRKPRGPTTDAGAHLQGMKFSVRSPDELISVIPHVLGFTPQDSLVLVPLSSELPAARVDLPTSAREREQVWESIGGVYARHTRPGAQIGLFSFSADRDYADRLGQDFAIRLQAIGVDVPIRLWASDTQWADLDTGAAGPLTPETRQIVAAQTVLNGLAQPAPSREALAASLVGDDKSIAALLADARTATAASTTHVDATLALDRLDTFHSTGIRLDDPEAARLLVSVKSIPIRDQLWHDMNAENATSHVALWSDLTRRAPDSVRAAPATMLAFASWLKGHGALAWCALDQVPQGQPYPAAELVTAVVQNGVRPSRWQAIKTAVATEGHTRGLDGLASWAKNPPVPRPPTI